MSLYERWQPIAYTRLAPPWGPWHDAARWMTRLGRRRRARQAAKCPGEAQAVVEPGIPEWELLPRANPWRLGPGNPRPWTGTPRTETS
jgi:hypothetical protein